MLDSNTPSHTPEVNSITSKISTLTTKQNEINHIVSTSDFNSLVQVSDSDATFVLNQFKKNNFTDLSKITDLAVTSLADDEFKHLNNQLKQFTSQMNKIQTPGLFALIDDLSKNVNDAELTTIWNKAVNAKPTLWSRFLNIFDKKSAKESLTNQYEYLTELVNNRSSGLETKLNEIDKKLLQQENEQRSNIVALEQSFDTYYQAFLKIREQFIFLIYLENKYQEYLNSLSLEFKEKGSNELILQNELSNSQEIMNSIIDKRTILHKTLLQLPIAAEQNRNLVEVCKSLRKEIHNTRTSSFMSIRSNLLNLGTALKTQQALMTNQSAQDLDHNLALLSTKVSTDLSIKGKTLSSESRLREAKTIQQLVNSLDQLSSRLLEAEQQSRANIQEANSILLESTNNVKEFLSEHNHVNNV